MGERTLIPSEAKHSIDDLADIKHKQDLIHIELRKLNPVQHRQNLEYQYERDHAHFQHEQSIQNQKEDLGLRIQQMQIDLEQTKARAIIEAEHIKAQAQLDIITHQAQTDIQIGIYEQTFQQLQHSRNINQTAHDVLATAFTSTIQHLTQVKAAKTAHQSELEKLRLQNQLKDREHKRELQQIEARHKREMMRIFLKAELREHNYTHQKTTDLCVLLLEKALHVRDAEINRETIARWIDETQGDL